MKIQHLHFVTLLTAVAFLGMTTQAIATSAEPVLNLEGNPTCNSLAINSIITAKDNSIAAVGDTETVSGPDGQEFTYTIDPDSNHVSNWNTTLANVSFVILKGSGPSGARVFYYDGGVAFDNVLDGPGSSIAQISFCYGNTVGITEMIHCDDAEAFGPDACTAFTGRVIHAWAHETDGHLTCTCGSTFVICDRDALPGTEHACVDGSETPGRTTITGGPGSYICPASSTGGFPCFTEEDIFP